MRFITLFSLAAFTVLGAACSSSSSSQPPSCSLPQGQDCCDGDIIGTFTCDAQGHPVCSEGTRLTPSNECTLPLPGDGGTDAPSCALPALYECCDGDQLGTFTCAADGGVVCEQGTRLTPSSECITPPPRDGGTDALPCSLPAGQQCCHGDVVGSFTCAADGGVVCEQGTALSPSAECITPPPHDAGNDAPGN